MSPRSGSSISPLAQVSPRSDCAPRRRSPAGFAYPLATAGERAALNARLADTGITVLYVEMIAISADTVPADHRAHARDRRRDRRHAARRLR
jgi:hypothetical protein